MGKNIFVEPSFYAHIISGIFMFIAMIIMIMNYSKIKSLDSYRFLILIMLLSVSIGIHGISHLGLETIYGYNPLVIDDITTVNTNNT
jgi:hypothetical protein